MNVVFTSGISWKGLCDFKGSTDHTLRTAVLNTPGKVFKLSFALASSSFPRIPLPALDSLPPQPQLRALSLGSSRKGLSPWKVMPERVLRLGREVGGQVFPPWTWEQSVPEGARPTHHLLGFVPHQLHVHSRPRQESVTESLRGILSPGSNVSDVRPTKREEQSCPTARSVWRNCSYLSVSSAAHWLQVAV